MFDDVCQRLLHEPVERRLDLGREAVFAEPAGATSYAGVVQAVEEGLIGSGEQAVAVITGSGLKDVPAAMRAAGEALIIEPTLEALRAALG